MTHECFVVITMDNDKSGRNYHVSSTMLLKKCTMRRCRIIGNHPLFQDCRMICLDLKKINKSAEKQNKYG